MEIFVAINKLKNLGWALTNMNCTSALVGSSGSWYKARSFLYTSKRKFHHLKAIQLIWSSWVVFLGRSECTNKGGTSSGSCASGFGVCCTCKSKSLQMELQENQISPLNEKWSCTRRENNNSSSQTKPWLAFRDPLK